MKIRRSQYRCSFKLITADILPQNIIDRCCERFTKLIKEGKVCNASFYKYNSMGFLYVEEIVEDMSEPYLPVDQFMSDLQPYLKPWPEENGDKYFAPMVNVYYHYGPEEDLDLWEKERTTAKKERIGRVAFLFPKKLPSYVMHHNAIVEEGLLKGDKYAYISLHENLLFSYYEEPRNNVNIKGIDEESKAIESWIKADPESHFDREKAKGSNFLIIPCLFTVDRIDYID